MAAHRDVERQPKNDQGRDYSKEYTVPFLRVLHAVSLHSRVSDGTPEERAAKDDRGENSGEYRPKQVRFTHGLKTHYVPAEILAHRRASWPRRRSVLDRSPTPPNCAFAPSFDLSTHFHFRSAWLNALHQTALSDNVCQSFQLRVIHLFDGLRLAPCQHQRGYSRHHRLFDHSVTIGEKHVEVIV